MLELVAEEGPGGVEEGREVSLGRGGGGGGEWSECRHLVCVVGSQRVSFTCSFVLFVA